MLKAVAYILANNAGVTALVGQRIKPIHEAQGQALPYVTYQAISITRFESRDGLTGIAVGICQLNCYAETYSAVVAIADAVKIALAHQPGTYNAEVVHVIRNLSGPEDLLSSPNAATEVPIYAKTVDVEITYQEAVA